MSMYADKKQKSISQKSSKNESLLSAYGGVFNQEIYWWKELDRNHRGTEKKENTIKDYLMRNYQKLIHKNSKEPEKLGVKAFTKNAEVYLAPGEGDETLKHELGHVVQQKTENVPTTTKIGDEKVNLDPRLEKEADEIAEHIEDHITEIISSESISTETKDVIQFKLPDDDELREIIKAEAEKQNLNKICVYASMSDIISKVRDYYDSQKEYWKSWFTNPLTSYKELCVKWALESMKGIINRANGVGYYFYLSLENSKIRGRLSDTDKQKNEIINKVMDMLSTEKIFPKAGKPAYTLNMVMQWLSVKQCRQVKNCILILKNYCDAKGIKSVLEGANTNVSSARTMLYEPTYKTISDSNKKALAKSFTKRLQFMTKYIERVAQTRDSDERMFKDKYWIRSTGSDPHSEGQHALFLVNKQNQKGYETDSRKQAGEIFKVYKPHDLSADNAVVGKKGVFNSINDLFKKEKTLKDTIIADEDAFATINIDVAHHIEEYITKKGSMSQEEADKYFFRAGMLKVITDAMAVIDLHQDNIMPGFNNLPFIIDAEVDFFDYSSSGLESALTKDVYGGMTTGGITRPTNSTFKIATDGKKLNSGESFMPKSSRYRKAYNDGYNFMLETIYDKLDGYADLYQSYLKNIPKNSKIRIVPIETPQFAIYLQDAIVLPESRNDDYLVESSRKTTKGSNRQEYASFLADEIEEKLTTNDELKAKSFIFRNEREKLKAKVDKGKLTKSIKKTFDNGTIIAMYCDMNGNIYLDNAVIGKILFNDKQINQEQLIEKMKNKFVEVINEFYNKKLFDESGLSQTQL